MRAGQPPLLSPPKKIPLHALVSKDKDAEQGRPQDFGWGGAKSLARSAKNILNFAPRKTYFCPRKINFLPYYFLVWNYFGGGHAPPQNQLWGGPWPPLPPPPLDAPVRGAMGNFPGGAPTRPEGPSIRAEARRASAPWMRSRRRGVPFSCVRKFLIFEPL